MTLKPRRNRCHFLNDIFKYIFFNEDVWISIKISLNFVPMGPVNNIPALVQIMACHLLGAKPEPMLVRSLTHICVTRPQRVKQWWPVKGCIYYMLSLSELTHLCISFSELTHLSVHQDGRGHGTYFNIKIFPCIRIPIINIRQLQDLLILIMEMYIPVRQHFYAETLCNFTHWCMNKMAHILAYYWLLNEGYISTNFKALASLACGNHCWNVTRLLWLSLSISWSRNSLIF